MVWSSLVLAAREIRRNLVRSALTVLGIVIGVASVIAIFTLGNGATTEITSNISGLGDNLLIMTPGSRRRGPPGPTGASSKPFTLEDAPAIAKEIDAVEVAAGTTGSYLMASVGEQRRPTVVTGASPGVFAARNWKAAEGRLFNAADFADAAPVCVVGHEIATKLFDGKALGKTISLGLIDCKVIGVMEEQPQGLLRMDQNDIVVMPISTYHKELSTRQDVTMILIKVRATEEIRPTKKAVAKLMRKRRNITEKAVDDFRIAGVEEIADAVRTATGILTSVVSAIAGISLLVGGIGIMNVMLVSVTERTREIGVRMAIGARESDVLLQFLIEAALLAALGGVAGVATGLAGAAVAAWYIGLPFAPSLWIIVLAVVFSAAIGLIFGFFPARRAARLNPIDALRHE